MSQHDYVISDQNGLSFLADLNAVLAAIVGNNSGATEPATAYAYMLWADTANGLLKQRNAANNAWIPLAQLSNFALPSVQTQLATRFTAGGSADAITGTLAPPIAGYSQGLRVTTTPGGANSVAAPTINVNSLGNKTIKKRSSSGAKVALEIGEYNPSGPFDFEYDGTDFILLNPLTDGNPSFKNYLINGGCVIAQRGNVAAVKDVWTYGGADRIPVNIGGTTASGTIQRYAGAASSSGYAQGISVTTTGVGTVFFQQRIESFNALPLNGKAVTVSALVYQNTGVAQTASIVIGKPTTTADVFSAQTALGTSTGFSIPSGTPTRISYTLSLGSSDATLGLYAQIGYSSIGAVTAKDFWITDFQLERGEGATPLEIRTLGLERMLCQRYYQEVPANALGIANYSPSAGQYAGAATYCYPVSMRNAGVVTPPTWSLTNSATPTVWLSSTNSLSYYTLSSGVGSVIAFSTSPAIVNSEI